MPIQLHGQTTTPKVRAVIQAGDEPARVLAEHHGISKRTVWKWRKRESVEDRSHTTHRHRTTLTPAREAVAVELLCGREPDCSGPPHRSGRARQRIRLLPRVPTASVDRLPYPVGFP